MELGDSIWYAIALVFLIEGLVPFISPTGWRRMFFQLTQLRDGQIRFFALLSIAVGVLMFWLG